MAAERKSYGGAFSQAVSTNLLRPKTDVEQAQVLADHHMRVDLVSARPKKVLIVVANPSTSTTMGWPVGFWGAELTHPYYELTERGVEVTITSPDGGKVEMSSA